MSFRAHQILFLQRLVSERPAQRRAAGISRYFAEHYSLGTLVGGTVEYRDEHHRIAESLLRNHDLPVALTASATRRADLAKFGGLSEKTLSEAPHAGSIAVKCIGGCRLAASTLRTPEASYLVVTPELAGRIACDRLLLVENLETFRQLERYGWIDYQGLAVLAIYRGDTLLPTREALELLRARTEKIWAFVDFDPAGLVIANALPSERLERIVLPSFDWLRSAANSLRGRQLFDDQIPGARATLERSSHPQVIAAWAEMRELCSGVTQERMLAAGARGGR